MAAETAGDCRVRAWRAMRANLRDGEAALGRGNLLLAGACSWSQLRSAIRGLRDDLLASLLIPSVVAASWDRAVGLRIKRLLGHPRLPQPSEHHPLCYVFHPQQRANPGVVVRWAEGRRTSRVTDAPAAVSPLSHALLESCLPRSASERIAVARSVSVQSVAAVRRSMASDGPGSQGSRGYDPLWHEPPAGGYNHAVALSLWSSVAAPLLALAAGDADAASQLLAAARPEVASWV